MLHNNCPVLVLQSISPNIEVIKSNGRDENIYIILYFFVVYSVLSTSMLIVNLLYLRDKRVTSAAYVCSWVGLLF